MLITRNSRDFAPLAREWAEASRHHAGMILIWTLDHSQFAEIVTGVERYLERWPEQGQWRDLVVALWRSPFGSGLCACGPATDRLGHWRDELPSCRVEPEA